MDTPIPPISSVPDDSPITPPDLTPHRDRALTIGVWISLSVAVFSLIIGGIFVIPRIIHTDNTTSILARSDELRACSASFSAELVSGPTAAALKALADHGSDSPEFRAAVAHADPARFIRLTRLARLNPSAFIAECRRTTSAPFKSCAQARASTVTPIRRGSPGYNPDLDSDKDGEACE